MLDRFWLDGSLPVAFVFYEQPATSAYFSLRPGYEFLAGDMIAYAETAYCILGGIEELVLSEGQKALAAEAERHGWRAGYAQTEYVFDFRKGKLDYPLPEGYHFVDAGRIDPLKAAKCLWDGFNSETEGPFAGWDVPVKRGGMSPHELYRDALGAAMSPPPHATHDRTVVIADESGEYACFSGMWWVPENSLAYMEPLCTVPPHRHRGLAAAALAAHDRALRPLGAEVMTGGGSAFYRKIGYKEKYVLLRMRKG